MTASNPFGALNGETDRRTALAVLAAGLGAASAAGWPAMGLARSPALRTLPWLASPEQLAAENLILQVEQDPQVKIIQARLKAELAASTRGQIPDAAATLDDAIAQWTRSLAFAEVVKHPADPVMLWATDDTSRSWLGHTLGGVGTSGDNPDNIYRMGYIEGGGSYELLGQFHPDSRPTQLLIEVDGGDMTNPARMMGSAPHTPQHDIHSNALISDRELVVTPDGSFRITVGGVADGPNHLSIPPSGPCAIGARDLLGDWKLRPTRMRLRRLDKVPVVPFGLPQLRQSVIDDLAGYVRFWADFPNMWMGGLQPNTHSQPSPRPGSWGFVAGLNFRLAPDEALLVTTSPGQAKYTGFQINNPWMIAPDARTRQVCLNKTQSTANADGTVTYVLARSDPGVANWLDTAGMRDGLAILRWQQVPPTMTNDGLIRDFRVIKLGELTAMTGLPRVSAQERQKRVAARTADYNTRVS
jgi:hypothetical protein